MEKRLRISFQGSRGANSDAMAKQAHPDCETLPCLTFSDAILAVEQGSADRAMIPVENSIAGRVADMHSLLPTLDLHVVAEYFLEIKHFVLGVPGSRLENIEEVHSHVHALAQCRKWIQASNLAPRVHADTAGAADMVSRRGDPKIAAISTRIAAEIYGLEVLAEGVEDNQTNTTRFLELAPHPVNVQLGATDVVTTVIFRVRSIPAALFKVLGGFATNSLNITRLESHTNGQDFSLAQFCIDVEGHPEDKRMINAMRELNHFAEAVRVLGTYPADKSRLFRYQ